MYFPPNKYFGPKHALQSSDSSAATEFRIKSHFYSTLSNAAHCTSPERRIDQRWRSIEADLVSFHWELGKGYFLGTHENVLRMLSTTNRCMNFAHIIYMQYPYNKLYSALRKIALTALWGTRAFCPRFTSQSTIFWSCRGGSSWVEPLLSSG